MRSVTRRMLPAKTFTIFATNSLTGRSNETPRPTPRRRAGLRGLKNYWAVAAHLMESARALVTLGDEEYGNAMHLPYPRYHQCQWCHYNQWYRSSLFKRKQHADGRAFYVMLFLMYQPWLSEHWVMLSKRSSSMSIPVRCSRRQRLEDYSGNLNAPTLGRMINYTDMMLASLSIYTSEILFWICSKCLCEIMLVIRFIHSQSAAILLKMGSLL